MTNTPRKRVVRGVREGGQFATEQRTESDVSLGAAAVAVADADDFATDETELSGDELLAVALVSSRHHIRVRNLRFVAPDDIAMSTIETALRARKNDPTRKITPAYVHSIAGGHVSIGLRGHLRPEDRKAIGIYTARLTELEKELGRKTSSKERVALATSIRDEWPDKRHRPSVDFVRLSEMRIVSLDRPAHDGEQTLGDTLAESHGVTDDDLSVDADSAMGQAMTAATNGRKADARRALWHAFSEQTGAPDAHPGTLSRARAAECRAAIADAGGVRKAMADWDRGETDTPACRALFAPFGAIDAEQREEVVEVFTAHSAYADELYDSALRTAAAAKAA